jgi:hypothetical protein
MTGHRRTLWHVRRDARPEAPASYVYDDTAEHRPFGKRNAVAHLFDGIQTPFVILRFIFRKAAWLTLRFYNNLRQIIPL